MRTILQFYSARAEGDVLPFDRSIASSGSARDALRGGEDLAGIYYAGGTKGRPMGVMLSHANLVSNAMNMNVGMGFDSDAVYLHAAPMFQLSDSCLTYGVTMLGGTHVFVPSLRQAGSCPRLATNVASVIRISSQVIGNEYLRWHCGHLIVAYSGRVLLAGVRND
jgi:acyl-CoA synthetase (AMP-forming)/AMP-acid ligase II